MQLVSVTYLRQVFSHAQSGRQDQIDHQPTF